MGVRCSGCWAFGSILSTFLALAALAGAIYCSLQIDYFYLDWTTWLPLRGYAYPQGRIKRCFWLSLIGGVVVGIRNSWGAAWFAEACNIVITVITLVLLWQYLEAVKQAEQNEQQKEDGNFSVLLLVHPSSASDRDDFHRPLRRAAAPRPARRSARAIFGEIFGIHAVERREIIDVGLAKQGLTITVERHGPGRVIM